jgi:hypothetical protein
MRPKVLKMSLIVSVIPFIIIRIVPFQFLDSIILFYIKYELNMNPQYLIKTNFNSSSGILHYEEN